MRVRITDETANVRKRMKAASFKSITQAAAYVWGISRRSIGTGYKTKRDASTGERVRVGAYTPSKPGKPPKSPTGRLKRSIAFDVDREKTDAVIGPTKSVIGGIGATHEHSGQEPPKQRRNRLYNFKLAVGGHGPARATRFRVDGVAKLRTTAQVRRAQALVDGLDAPRWAVLEPTKSPRNYPARPFMGPALARSQSRLPSFWKNALQRS